MSNAAGAITVDTRGLEGEELIGFFRNSAQVRTAVDSLRVSFHDLKFNISDSLRRAARGFGEMAKSMGGVLSAMMQTSTVSAGLEKGMMNLYRWGRRYYMSFSGSLDLLATDALYLRNSLAALTGPLVDALAPALNLIIDRFVDMFNVVNQIFARLSGADTYVAAKKFGDRWDSEAGRVQGALAAVRKYILGFDELNIMSSGAWDGGDSEGGETGGGTSAMFETRRIEGGLKSFADQMREAFESGDWAALGTMFGEKINALADGVDWAALGKKVGGCLNGAIQTAYYLLDTVNFTNIGDRIAQLMNSALEQIDFEKAGSSVALFFTGMIETFAGFVDGFDWSQFAQKAAEAVNGFAAKLGERLDAIDWARLTKKLVGGLNDFIGRVDWEALGKTFAGRINDLLSILGSAAETFDWTSAGASLATALNNLFHNVDWDALGNWLNRTIQGVLDFGIAFVNGFDAVGFADGVGRALDKVEWDKIAQKLWTLLSGALQKLGELAGALLLGGKADLGLKISLLKDGFETVAKWLGIDKPLSVIGKLTADSDSSLPRVFGSILDVVAKLTGAASGTKTLPGIFGSVLSAAANLTKAAQGSRTLVGLFGNTVTATASLSGMATGSKTLVSIFGNMLSATANLSGMATGSKTLAGIFGDTLKAAAMLTKAADGSKTLAGLFGNKFGVEAKLTGKASGSKDLSGSIEGIAVFKDWFDVEAKLTGGSGKEVSGSSTKNAVFQDWFNVIANLTEGKGALSSSIDGPGIAFLNWFNVWANLDGKKPGSKDPKDIFAKTITITAKIVAAAGALSKIAQSIWDALKKKIQGKAEGGIITSSGISRGFASGGAIAGGRPTWWDGVQKYASGTARAHGTVFVAGEAGPEIMGHVNGRTEILNKSQLAQTMLGAVEAGMAQAVNALGRFLAGHMSACTEAIVGAIAGRGDFAALAAVGGVDYRAPAMASGSVLPYDVAAQIDRSASDLRDTLDANNEDLIQTIISVAGQIVAAVQASGRGRAQGGGSLTAEQVIDEINRRTQMFSASPLIGG